MKLYVLVWRRDGSSGISWFIRCLGPDGFYGEVRSNSPGGGLATGVRGHFTPTERERVAELLTELSAAGPTEPGPCFALLGSYTVTLGQSEVIFKYELGAESNCPLASRFLELHSILESYMADAYAEIGL